LLFDSLRGNIEKALAKKGGLAEKVELCWSTEDTHNPAECYVRIGGEDVDVFGVMFSTPEFAERVVAAVAARVEA
jgi:hypothetical protein